MPKRFFSAAIALEAPSLAIFRVAVDGHSVDAAPTFVLRLTVSERFFSAAITRRIVFHAFRLGRVNDLAMNATPTILRRTMLARFLFATVAGSIVLQAFLLCRVDDLAINAAPAISWRMTMNIIERLLFRGVAFAIVLSAFRAISAREVNGLSIDTAPAPLPR